MEDLSLHILDIAENSIAAEARKIEIIITEETDKDLLTIEQCKKMKAQLPSSRSTCGAWKFQVAEKDAVRP